MVTEASKAVLPIKSCWATTPAVEDGDGHEMGTAGALVHMIKAGRWAVERMTTRAATAGILERPMAFSSHASANSKELMRTRLGSMSAE